VSWQLAVLLLAAITAEMIATTALRLSEGFSRLGPSIVVVVGYGASFYLLAMALKRGLEMGIAYAIWSGLGTVAIVLIGVLFFQEKLNLSAIDGIVLVILGVVLINYNSGSP
jgi:small multidrug resistance pump